MGETFTRTVQAAEASGMVSCSLPISAGVWEIVSLSVIIGGSTPVLTVAPVLGNGTVRYESDDQFAGSTADLAQSQRLAAGTCSLFQPILMTHPQLVIGVGRIKTYIQQEESVEHTLTVTYRRVYG